MSLIFTESFGAFGRYNGSDAWDTTAGAGNAARSAFALNLARAGYTVVNAANAAKDSSGGLVVRADPVYPERNALVHSSDVTAGVNLGVSASFRKALPTTDKQIIIGFSVFVPAEYVANVNTSTVPVFRLNASMSSDATWSAIGITLASAKEAFRICNDLSIRWGTDAAQSSRKLVAGQMNYLEVRISAGEVSVWLEDIFVMQKVVSLMPQAVGFIFENNANAGAGGTNMSGLPGRWALSNMYYIAIDGIAPQVRLGPTTRVIAQRPDTDVDVRFIRPAGYDYNWQVASQDLVDAPSGQLQSTTVGDFDLYQTAAGLSGDAIRTMGMVHAVAVKALAQNLEPEVHNVKPFLKYGASAVEAADTKTRDLTVHLNSPTLKAIRGMTIIPADNSLLIYGDGEMCYRSGPNFNLDVWTRVSETGSAYNFMVHWNRGDGVLLVTNNGVYTGATTGNLYWYDPNAPTVINKGTVLRTAYYTGKAGLFVSPGYERLYLMMDSDSGITAASTSYDYITGHMGGSPHTSAIANGASTLTPSTPAMNNAVGFKKIASKPDNSQTILIPGPAQPDNIYRVSAYATSLPLNQSAHNFAGQAFTALTWDGTQWLMGVSNSGYTNAAPYIVSSPDGASWSAPTAIGNSGSGAAQTLNFGCSNVANQETIFGGNSGALVMTLDGKNWRQMPRLTTQPLYCGICLPNGDFVLAGGAGVMLRFRSLGADTALQPLAGYNMTFGSAVFNPATAAPWTPAQAADAKFGVKLTT